MLASIYCKDAEGSAGPRKDNFSAHLKHIEAIEDKIKVAGPILGPDGESHEGSLFILEVDSLDEAAAILKADPFSAAGVWRETNVQEYKGVVGSWVGGKSW